ncbi:MAG: 4-hydroxythreonine-4-phosphate dehydrogenase PdxA [Bacteroidia bacterium]|nr:MAG: 4-hydroxythreonine-4-phosphate dehydrogenase PdxA [Bacteroidia bacterium]PIE86476.1 MAG: 4-hydroxythreonine-4-phosphate dehydrogenase PdxA [Bacteroidia bacterium]
MNEKIKVGITQGDINGISYEIILKTLADNRIYDLCTPIVYGSPKIAAYHRKTLNIPHFNFNNVKDAASALPKRSNLINCVDDSLRVELGKSTPSAGSAALKSLELASQDLKNGEIDILLTAPINKHNIQNEDFHFPGHTEYLAEKFDTKTPLMLMVGESLKVAVLTGHVPLCDVAKHVTKENIIEKVKILHNSLVKDFTIRGPKIAILGLNPHAGDQGLLGKEEQEIIIPAIEHLRNKENIVALGPFSSDGLFGSNQISKFDAIFAMYHDQGLTPFKTIEFDTGVNFTAGLPVVRTSPGHGTAYEIAGIGKASPNSFRKALYLACEIYKNRKMHEEITAEPLQKYDVE